MLVDAAPSSALIPREQSVSHRSGSEAELVEKAVRLLRGRWPVRAIGLETKSHGRCRTDVCVRVRDLNDPEGPEYVVGIEAKMTNFMRALRQAARNQYAVDASFVAMPVERITSEMIEAAKEFGVGVLGVGPNSLTVLEPARVGQPDASLRERLNAQLSPARARGRVKVAEIAWGRP